MKIELYICDTCKKELSKAGSGKPHLSINLNGCSGWVAPLIDEGIVTNRWKHQTTTGGIKQFCNGKCLEMKDGGGQ